MRNAPARLLCETDLVLGGWNPIGITTFPFLLTMNAGVEGHAQFNLGLAYDRGDGVRQDQAKAAFWYRKAAEQGDTDSQFLLGMLYVAGEAP